MENRNWFLLVLILIYPVAWACDKYVLPEIGDGLVRQGQVNAKNILVTTILETESKVRDGK